MLYNLKSKALFVAFLRSYLKFRSRDRERWHRNNQQKLLHKVRLKGAFGAPFLFPRFHILKSNQHY